MISAIAAVDADWGIGFDGELLERIPADMKHFRELTENNVVIMGRKTWDSLPSALPNRKNFVISSKAYGLDGAYVMNMNTAKQDLAALRKYEVLILEEIFIIGGGQIYTQLLPYCDRVYITKIYRSHEKVDTYFPIDLDHSPDWRQVDASEIRENDSIPYQFITYERV